MTLTRSLSEYLVERRTFLGKAGAASLGAVLSALGAPEAAGAFASMPPPTSYSTLLGICTGGAATNTYTPGLKNTLQNIHAVHATTFSPCAVAQNKRVSGTAVSLDQIMSCSAVTDLSGTGVINYTNGQSSNFTVDSWTAYRALGQVTGASSGIISNGPFNGARVWGFVVRAVSDPSACAS